jgi:branched-subunit amino acid aminotransferase/4-amino-4-deoxychorismate lyase
MFCTGTMGEIVPVREVDGHSIPLGSLTARIAARFAARAAVEGEWVGSQDQAC